MRVIVGRTLPAAGLDRLSAGFSVRVGGPTADADWLRDEVRGAAGLVTDPTMPVDDALITAAGDSLRVVSQFAVGYDNVDLDALRRHGVRLTNTPDVLTDATAELAVGLMLAAGRRLVETDGVVRRGGWTGWEPEGFLGVQLSGATVGLVGLGRIGRRTAEMLAGFDVDLRYWSRTRDGSAEAELGLRWAEWDELLARSDFLSLHVPLSDETHNLIDTRALELLKPGAILVNTARGGLVDTEALVGALRSGRLAAAGLDVYEDEPNVPAELIDLPQTVLAPHVGSATRRTRDDMAVMCAENVIAVLEGGEPPSEVPL
ncbi:MAG TPA: D-glycerate dehydrogenase [Solirubrobacteraceae bacterium]